MDRLVKKRNNLLAKAQDMLRQAEDIELQLNSSIGKEISKLCEERDISVDEFFSLVDELFGEAKQELNIDNKKAGEEDGEN